MITHTKEYTSQEISTAFEENFDPANPGEARNEETKRQLATQHCGQWRFFYDPKTGRQKSYQDFCKNPDICPDCAEREKGKVYKTLNSLIGCQAVVVSVEDEKQLARKYPATDYFRQPLEDDKTLFVIKTDEEIGEELNGITASIFSEKICLDRGRRRSGKLGKSKEVEPTGELVEYREMSIEFDGSDDAPKTAFELEKMVQDEVEIDHSPQTIDELQYFLYLLEQKTQEICKRHGMSFNFLLPKKVYINMDNVSWDWVDKGDIIKEMENSLANLLRDLKK